MQRKFLILYSIFDKLWYDKVVVEIPHSLQTENKKTNIVFSTQYDTTKS